MSVYLGSIMIEHNLDCSDVVWGKGPGWAVAETPTTLYAAEDQVIEPQPVQHPPDPGAPHPCDPAHALVHGDKTAKARRDRLAAASPLVYIHP